MVEKGKGQPGAAEAASASWITIEEVKDENLASLFLTELDKGEAEAIVLCREQHAEAVLLDEKDARRVARRLGLPVLGTVGVLIWAKRAGLVANLQEQLDALQT